MKFKFLAILISLFSLNIFGQTTKQQHEQTHRDLIANQKSRIDKSVLQNLMENDILNRENNNEVSQIIDELLIEAQSHIGKRYVHATHGPNTFDCSGFSSYVYKQFGYKISTGVVAQYSQGEKVEKQNARKGDLIFFQNRQKTRVGHVGIIWNVDSKTGTITFIHASIKGVKISELKGYYIERFVGIKRIIK